jgi:hypothetical protein
MAWGVIPEGGAARPLRHLRNGAEVNMGGIVTVCVFRMLFNMLTLLV